MELNNVNKSNGPEISELFNKYFGSVYSNSNLDLKNYTSQLPDMINVSHKQFSLSKIFLGLGGLSSNCNPGSDKIPEIILKSCKYALSVPIHILFNWSLSSGIYPSSWKLSYVIPVHKTGPKNVISNYRPISKLSSLPTFFEKLLEPILSQPFKHLFNSNQHGWSTETNLLCFYSDILEPVEKGLQVDVIYTDFYKAFDSVNHRILILKLKQIGFLVTY